MAKAAACKCKEQECECPEWIFTFADLVMLMMGFFVILWVLKPPAGKDGSQTELPLDVLAAIRDAFKYLPDPDSKDPVDAFMIAKKIEQMKPHKGEGPGAGKNELDPRGAEGTDRETLTIRPGKVATVGAPIPFDTSQTALTADGRRRLIELAPLIRGKRIIVLVKGHASLDDLGENATAEQRMDLSLRRAQVVADFLTAQGVESDILRVQGCSIFEPIVERVYSPELRIPNRRVEVQSTGILVSEVKGPAASAGQVSPTTIPAGEPALTEEPTHPSARAH